MSDALDGSVLCCRRRISDVSIETSSFPSGLGGSSVSLSIFFNPVQSQGPPAAALDLIGSEKKKKNTMRASRRPLRGRRSFFALRRSAHSGLRPVEPPRSGGSPFLCVTPLVPSGILCPTASRRRLSSASQPMPAVYASQPSPAPRLLLPLAFNPVSSIFILTCFHLVFPPPAYPPLQSPSLYLFHASVSQSVSQYFAVFHSFPYLFCFTLRFVRINSSSSANTAVQSAPPRSGGALSYIAPT